jgi:arylsulfatase
LYEGGIRVPLIARWPGHIPADVATDYAAAIWDLFPTFAEVARVSRHASGTDGVSLLPVLRGRDGNQRNRLYWQSRNGGFAQAVRTGPWKVVRPAGKIDLEDVELYNLVDDPRESTNVASEHPEVIAKVTSNKE